MSHRYRAKQIPDCLSCGYAIFYGSGADGETAICWRHVGSNSVRCNTKATPPKTHENPWNKPWPRKPKGAKQ